MSRLILGFNVIALIPPPSEVEMFTNTDEAFAGFSQYCAAAPDKCLLAQGNRTAEQVSKTVFDLLQHIKFNPIPIVLPGGGLLGDYSTLKAEIVNDLYAPFLWPKLDAILYSALTENTTSLIELMTPKGGAPKVPTTEALRGIRCGDSVAREEELSGIQHTLDARYELSKVGGDYWDLNTMVCAQWKIAAKERVVPELGRKVHTNHPILLLGNRYDPVTSIASARNTSARFEGSVVLETIEYGVRTILLTIILGPITNNS